MASGINDAELLEHQRLSQAAFFRIIGEGHPDSFVAHPAPGVQATVAPVSPERSLPNSVLYEDPAAVLDAYDELAALYAESGVRAWTVWVRPGDDALVAELETRGHAIDGTPAIMGAAIEELDLAQRTELDLEPDVRWRLIGEINDRAYGLPAGSLCDPLAGLPADRGWLLVARVDGDPVACAVFEVTSGDCEAGFVATLPEARGRGLGAELMREGLRRARAAGAQTATLEASLMGQPVYARIGYRQLGQMRMMERRCPAS